VLYSEAKQGRIFVVRLQDGEILHEALEGLAREQGIQAAALLVLGGADRLSRLVVGPEDGRAQPVVPMEHILQNVHEVAGTGTIFPDDEGRPVLHMHIACGRGGSAAAGCVRNGVKIWQVMEVIVFELLNSAARRLPDPDTGFKLLRP